MSENDSKTGFDSLMCYNVYALHHAFGRFYQAAFADTGFTYPKFIVLLALEDGGPMSLSDLSSRIGLEANSLSPMVKKMHSFGLIDRVRDPEDERRILLTLLPYGRKVLREARKVVNAGWDALDLPDNVMERTNAFLSQTRERLESRPPQVVMKVPPRDEDTT